MYMRAIQTLRFVLKAALGFYYKEHSTFWVDTMWSIDEWTYSNVFAVS